MGEAVYTVSVEELLPTIKHIIHTTTPAAIREATRELAIRATGIMVEEAPSSIQSGRGYRGPSLKHSVRRVDHSVPSEAIYTITPTKMVTGEKGKKHALWKILHYGSTNQRIIYPVNKKMLKFTYGGKTWFKYKVRRGIIPPHPFVERTKDRTVQEATGILTEVLTREYAKDAEVISI